MRHFFVLGLPRSGTSWISNFLTWGRTFCYHEVTYGCASLDDIHAVFEKTAADVVGTADTAASLIADALNVAFPGSKFVFVIRPAEEVQQSLEARGLSTDGLDVLTEHLCDAIRNPDLDSMTVEYRALFSQGAMRDIWRFVGGEAHDPFPWERFELLRQMNVQDVTRFMPVTPETTAQIEENIERFGGLLEDVYHFRQEQGLEERF